MYFFSCFLFILKFGLISPSVKFNLFLLLLAYFCLLSALSCFFNSVFAIFRQIFHFCCPAFTNDSCLNQLINSFAIKSFLLSFFTRNAISLVNFFLSKKTVVVNCLTFLFQSQFIQFSKTLYNIFHGDPEEESLYRAVAHVTSLLLKMEEVGRRLQESSSPSETTKPASTSAAEDSSTTEEASTTPESSDASSSHSSQEAAPEPTETEWSFSFEQVLASLLNEPTIVSFFERPVNIQNKLRQTRVAQLKLMANK